MFFGAHAFLFAQENESQVKDEVKEGFTYQMALSLSLSPILESKADDGSGKNHFATIKGMNIPIPYAQFIAMYTKSLFVNLVLGLQAMIYLNDNNQLAISSSLSSQRAFLEPPNTTACNIKKTASGREWCFTGVTVQWVYTF